MGAGAGVGKVVVKRVKPLTAKKRGKAKTNGAAVESSVPKPIVPVINSPLRPPPHMRSPQSIATVTNLAAPVSYTQDGDEPQPESMIRREVMGVPDTPDMPEVPDETIQPGQTTTDLLEPEDTSESLDSGDTDRDEEAGSPPHHQSPGLQSETTPESARQDVAGEGAGSALGTAPETK